MFATPTGCSYIRRPLLWRWERFVADIFEEIDEELKEENFKKLWDRYGLYVIVAVVLLIAGVAAFKFWESYRLDQQKEQSERYLAAMRLDEEGKHAEAAAALATFAEDASAGYAMIARFREASLRRKTGETAAAVDIYDTLAADDTIKPIYRDLATLLSVMTQADSGDPDALAARLKPLTEDGPWRHTANEYVGLFALKKGDTDGARKHFEAIADDAQAPAGARQRATELLQTLAK